VTNSANPSPVASGQEITYTIRMTNTGGSKVTNLVLSDQLNGVGTIQNPPAAPQFVLTSTQGSCSQSGQLVTCNGGSLNGGATWIVTIRGLVTAPNGSTLNNTASVTGTKSAQNFTTTASVQTQVVNNSSGSLPDLTINKTGPSSVVGGSDFDYVLTVNNLGTVQATGIKVVDTLPASVAFVSAAPTSLFTCTPAVPTPGPVTVVCTGGSVNQGQNATITIRVTAPPAAVPPAPQITVTNTAKVDPDNTIAESNEQNNTSAVVNTAVTTSPSARLLGIVKTDDPAIIPGAGPDPVQPLQLITYKIRVTNNATSRADDVVVVDGTSGLEAASIVATQVVTNGTVGNGNGCVVTAPEVRCKIRTLNPGGVLNITIVGKVIAPSGMNILNTATVTGNIKNVGETNTDTELTTVKPAVDLNITKADAPDPVCASSWPGPDAPTTTPLCQGALKYTFVVGNSGMATATNVVVRDVLPQGVIYDSFGPPAGPFVCPAPGPLPADNALVCTSASIPPESTQSFFIVVVPTASLGPITNVVTVDPDNAIFESDETNNDGQSTTQVATGIDLVIYKFDEPPQTIDPPGVTPAYPPATEGFDPIATSGTQTYTVRVDNIGTQDAAGIRVRDTLPAGTKFLSAVPDAAHGFTCTHDGSATGGVIECIDGHILGTKSEFYDPPPLGAGGGSPAGNDFATIIIKLFATPFVQPAMHNEVRVDPLGEIAEFDEANNLATQDTVVTQGDDDIGAFNELSVAKTQTDPGSNEVATSSTVTYEVVVTNNGTDPAVNVTVRDFLPAGFAFVEATDITTGPGSDPLDFFCTQSGTVQSGIVVNCTGATLDGTGNALGAGVPNARTIRIKATSASQPGPYTNSVIVDPDFGIPEGDESNNSASVMTTVKVGTPQGFIDLTIAKCDEPNPPDNNNGCSVDSDPVAPVGNITYILTVRNGGTDPAFNVVVRDVMPAGTTFVSADDPAPGPGAFTCGLSGGFIDCTGGTLEGTVDLIGDAAIGQSRTIKVVLKAPNANTTVTNQAIVDPANAIHESNETNNSASQTTTVTARLNLTLDKEGPDTAHQNDEDDYEITIKNDIVVAPGEAVDNVRVLDVLPIGLIPLSVTTEGNFTCKPFENPVNVLDCTGDLAPDQQVKITVHVFITANGGPLDNEACIDPDNVFTESTEADNCDTKTTQVFLKSPDLFVNKTADRASVSPGESLNYTVTVSNDGDASANPVTITDVLDVSKVDFQSAIASNGFTCVFASPNVNCTRAAGLAPGEFTAITIQVKVNGTASGTITNTASVPDNTAFNPAASECLTGGDPVCANEAAANTESTNGDNSDSVTTPVGASGFDLVVVSLEDAPDPVAPGGIVTYTAVVSNNGTSNATGVDVRTTLTPDSGITLTHVSSAGSNGFACTFAVTVDCTGDLPAGGTTTITMQFQVAGTVPPDKQVTVATTVDYTTEFTEFDETNNTKSNDTTIHANCAGCIDLVMGDIVDSPDPVARDEIVTYTIGVGNAGDTQSGPFNIVLTLTEAGDVDFDPGGFDASQPSDDYTATAGFNCTALGNVVTCNDNAGANNGLAPGEGVLITLKVHVKTNATNDFVNLQAQADPTNAVVEFSDANNDGTESTAVQP
jgi:uncharacterized repeat protein (TIGR01451 family)